MQRYSRILLLRIVVASAVAIALIAPACGSEGEGPLTEALEAHAAGRLDDAERLYRAALEDDASNEFAHYNLGLIAQTKGDDAEAAREYEQALAIDDSFVAALFNLAILRTKAKPDEAIRLYRKIIAVQPNHAGAHLNLGLLLRAQGKTPEGEAELRKAVELDPSLSTRVRPSPSPAGPEAP